MSKLFTMKLSNEERAKLDELAGGIPLATFIKSRALSDEQVPLLEKLISQCGGGERFFELLSLKAGSSLLGKIQLFLEPANPYSKSPYARVSAEDEKITTFRDDSYQE